MLSKNPFIGSIAVNDRRLSWENGADEIDESRTGVE